jgi:hypothetical protein
MLMINESSLSTVEIGLDSDFQAFCIIEETRREKKEEEEGEKRERESLNGRNWLCWHLDREERENDSFYFFRFVWGKKTKKKGEGGLLLLLLLLLFG